MDGRQLFVKKPSKDFKRLGNLPFSVTATVPEKTLRVAILFFSFFFSSSSSSSSSFKCSPRFEAMGIVISGILLKEMLEYSVPCLDKAQQPQEQRYPFLSVCAVVSCLQMVPVVFFFLFLSLCFLVQRR